MEIINNSKFNILKNCIEKIYLNNDSITDPKDIAEAFNYYFVDKINPLTRSGNKVTSLIQKNKYSFFQAPCLPVDVYKITNALKNTGSVRNDGLSTKVIKSVAGEISVPLSYIINLCIDWYFSLCAQNIDC